MSCLNCGAEFSGRPNRVYCSSRCKKRSEKKREKLKHLIFQVPKLRAQIENATRSGDWHAKRIAIVKERRATEELEKLSYDPLFLNTPNWLAPVITCLVRIENRTEKRP
jgi:hypothetical protein